MRSNRSVLRARAAVDALARLAESGDFFLAFPAIEALARSATVASRTASCRDWPTRARERRPMRSAQLGDEDAVGATGRSLDERGAPVGPIVGALARHPRAI